MLRREASPLGRLCDGPVGQEGVQQFLLPQVQPVPLLLQRQFLPFGFPRVAFTVLDDTLLCGDRTGGEYTGRGRGKQVLTFPPVCASAGGRTIH